MPYNPEVTIGFDYDQVDCSAIQHALDEASIVPNASGEVYSRTGSTLQFWAGRDTDSLPDMTLPSGTVHLKGSVTASFIDNTSQVTFDVALADGFTVTYDAADVMRLSLARRLLAAIADIDLDMLRFEPRFAVSHLTDVANGSYYQSPSDIARVTYSTTAHKVLDVGDDTDVCPAALRLTTKTDTAGAYGHDTPTFTEQHIVDLRRAAVVNGMSVIYQQAATMHPSDPSRNSIRRYGYGLSELQRNAGKYLYDETISAYKLGEAHGPSMDIYAAYHPQSVRDLETNLRGQSDFAKYVGILAADDINTLVAQPLTFAQAFTAPF